ncbi:MAG TPA: hypothetical protein VF614_15090 [Chthoniobacteraceae bacterium]|jgi:hypothetical protein
MNIALITIAVTAGVLAVVAIGSSLWRIRHEARELLRTPDRRPVNDIDLIRAAIADLERDYRENER